MTSVALVMRAIRVPDQRWRFTFDKTLDNQPHEVDRRRTVVLRKAVVLDRSIIGNMDRIGELLPVDEYPVLRVYLDLVTGVL